MRRLVVRGLRSVPMGIATVVIALCSVGCSAGENTSTDRPRSEELSPTSSASAWAEEASGKPSTPPSRSARASQVPTPSKTVTASPSSAVGSGGSTRSTAAATGRSGSTGANAVPQNPNRGSTPPPAPDRPFPTPEWSSGAWQPGDPVETTAPGAVPGQGWRMYRPLPSHTRRRSARRMVTERLKGQEAGRSCPRLGDDESRTDEAASA
jgi:hypothetical protein